MGADEEFTVALVAEDDYTSKIQKAESATKNLDKSQAKIEKSTMETNIAFLAQMEALDKIHSGSMKVVGALGELELVNDEQLKTLRQLTAAMDLIVGTYEIILVLRKADIIEKLRHLQVTNAQVIALGGLAAALGGVAFAMLAVSAGSEEQRAMYSVLTGVTWGLASAEFALAIAKATSISLGAYTPVIIAIIAGALAALGTYVAASQASAQTNPGEVKVVTRTGSVEVDEDEFIHRGAVAFKREDKISPPSAVPPSPMVSEETKKEPKSKALRPINIYIEGVFNVDNPESRRRLAIMIQRELKAVM